MALYIQERIVFTSLFFKNLFISDYKIYQVIFCIQYSTTSNRILSILSFFKLCSLLRFFHYPPTTRCLFQWVVYYFYSSHHTYIIFSFILQVLLGMRETDKNKLSLFSISVVFYQRSLPNSQIQWLWFNTSFLRNTPFEHPIFPLNFILLCCESSFLVLSHFAG